MTAAARRAHHHGRPTPRTKGGAEASAVLRPRRPRGREAASLPCSVHAVAAVHTPDGGDRPMRPVAWASGGGRARSARARRAQTAHEAARKARRAQCHGALAEARCHGRGGGWGGGGGPLQIKKRARARAVGRHAGAWRGLRDRGGLVAALHVREGRAPSATAARAPAWPTPCGQVCSWRHRPLHCGRLCALEPPLCEKGYPNAMSDTRVVHVLC